MTDFLTSYGGKGSFLLSPNFAGDAIILDNALLLWENSLFASFV